MEIPKVWRGGVLIKVSGSSMNHFDYFISRIHPARWVMHGWPGGFDVSGTVIACAPDVTSVSVGDRVFGFGQGFAEYATTRSWLVAKIPDSVTDVSKMGIYPSVAVTALQMLNQHWFDCANPERVRRVVIVGASGGVGSSLIQLIRAKCADSISVVAVSSGRNEAYCRSLGATEFIDYGKLAGGQLSSILAKGSVDLVFDTVSGNFGTPNYVADGLSLLNPSGVYVSTNSIRPMDYLRKIACWLFGQQGSQFKLFMVNLFRARKDLIEISKYVEEGKLELHAAESVEFNAENMQSSLFKIESRHQTGKVHIKVC
jgi:NADPH:quinone reductase-like Zn-dependent oxidoreductase